ncbi:PIG-L deacetylase family protein [Actinoalloteichus spitiensis]|uniref:PIG-L deacetylase family protein n=1 Tax=Actinoalloteichus spitiensis TaxID=252394 RepID=UPI000474E3DA|nr:PIG-L deacetylase family protein [Actinoalloteichus spitiensis]
MIGLRPERVDRVLVLGAHCDDIAIGAGGTLLSLCSSRPGLAVDALVCTGGGGDREAEERKALAALCGGADLSCRVLDLPDGRLPAHWSAVKDALERLAATLDPDLVFAPAVHDAHQDHRTLATLVPTVFRDHLVLGYEIPKWDGDLAQPAVFVPLSEECARAKSRVLVECYPSQADRHWFDPETFLGLARVRGVQSRARYAEGFFADKFVLNGGTPCACW